MIKKKMRSLCVIAAVLCCLLFSGCTAEISATDNTQTTQQSDAKADQSNINGTSSQSASGQITAYQSAITLSSIPAYSGTPYVAVNDNVPSFTDDDITLNAFENYSDLDSLGRCGVAYANVCQETMPTEKRGDISKVKPTGWHSVKYDFVDGKSLYNRCHLIGYQLTAENANEKNLITGTRYMNTEGMLPFENMVADYVKETKNHVLYRVTPIFEDNNLVASGVLMEAQSVEDHGEGVSFCVYAYNVQPGVTIDYATGDSSLASNSDNSGASQSSSTSQNQTNSSGSQSQTTTKGSSNAGSSTSSQEEIRGNSKSKIYHCPGQASYDEMADSKNLIIFHSEQEAQDAGYRKAKK
mgnify:FL=1